MLQEMLRNEDTRRMMFSPEMMRMQLQMQRAMNRNGGGGGSSFPAPGATDNTPQPSATATGGGATATPNQPDTTGATDPAAAGGAQPNPFASLFPGGASPFAPQQNTGDSNSNQQQNAANPFGNIFGGAQGGGANPLADGVQRMMQNPEAMRQMMQMMNGGGGGGGANPFGGFGQAPTTGGAGTGSPAPNPFAALMGGGGFGGPPAPADNRPPEQVYETQLAQLNEMGFYEFERNVSALRRSGGNVQGAIEHLLNGGA
jgi:ubiquilin